MTELDDDFFRRWMTDAEGVRVLRGLTAEETCWYEAYQAKRQESWQAESAAPRASVQEERADRDRWLELYERHEIARVVAVFTEVELREDKPTRHWPGAHIAPNGDGAASGCGGVAATGIHLAPKR